LDFRLGIHSENYALGGAERPGAEGRRKRPTNLRKLELMKKKLHGKRGTGEKSMTAMRRLRGRVEGDQRKVGLEEGSLRYQHKWKRSPE